MFDDEAEAEPKPDLMLHEKIMDWLLAHLADAVEDTNAEDFVAPNRHLCNGRVGQVKGVCPSKLQWRFRDFKYRVAVEFEFGFTLYLLAELNEQGEPPDVIAAFSPLEQRAREAEVAAEALGFRNKGIRAYGGGHINFQSFSKHAAAGPKDHPGYQKRIAQYQPRSSPTRLVAAAAVTSVHTALFLFALNSRALWAAVQWAFCGCCGLRKKRSEGRAARLGRSNADDHPDEFDDVFRTAKGPNKVPPRRAVSLDKAPSAESMDDRALRFAESMDPWSEPPKAHYGNPFTQRQAALRARPKRRFEHAVKPIPEKVSLNLAAPPVAPLRAFAKPRQPSQLAEWWRRFVLRQQGLSDLEHAPPAVRPDAKDAPKEVRRAFVLCWVIGCPDFP
jgi:hypothetical protein